jgi:hypothetical protein
VFVLVFQTELAKYLSKRKIFQMKERKSTHILWPDHFVLFCMRVLKIVTQRVNIYRLQQTDEQNCDSLCCFSVGQGKHQHNCLLKVKKGPPLWSSGQSSWLQIRAPGFDSRHYQKKKSSGSGTGSTQPREYN